MPYLIRDRITSALFKGYRVISDTLIANTCLLIFLMSIILWVIYMQSAMTETLLSPYADYLMNYPNRELSAVLWEHETVSACVLGGYGISIRTD